MHILGGAAIIYLASTIALGGLIKFSVKPPAGRFIVLADFVIPLLALWALVKAIFPTRPGTEASDSNPDIRALEQAEIEVEKKRQELFGYSSEIWVTKRFERRYNRYLERSLKAARVFGKYGVKRTGPV